MTNRIDDSKLEVSNENQLVLISKFLENQSKELDLKSKEIQSADKQVDGNLQLAMRELELVANDRKDVRDDSQQTLTKYLIFASSISLLLSVFLVIAFYLGKDAIALEIIKAIGYITAGILGGYSTGYNRGKSSNDSDD